MKKNKLYDAIFAFAIGDAMGVPYEFKQRGTFNCDSFIGNGTWQQVSGTFSDDTSLTIATCDSIREKGCIDCADILNKFRNWLNKSYYTCWNNVFDVGNTTYKAIMNGEGCADINSNGNGSLMRILPLAFIDCTDEEIKKISGITHNHEISQKACVIYVHIAKRLLKGENILAILNSIDEPYPFNRLKEINNLKEEQIRSTGYVVDSLEASLWAVATTNSFKECLFKAINLGNDTDTIGAIASGLAGIIYGYDDELLTDLKGKEIIEACLWD